MTKHKLINIFIASVWLVNGLFCKVLKFVPRHQEIVERILNIGYSRALTVLIGLGEITMAVWIISGYQRRLNAVIQILVIAAMNILEFFIAPDLLLWGRVNIVIAILFMLLIYYNEFRIHKTRLA